MAEIIIQQECSNGTWSAEIQLLEDMTYQTAMTSSDLLAPVIWSSSHSYSVASNTTKTFWVKANGTVSHKTVSFGLCAGTIPATPVIPKANGLPIPIQFNCVASFTLLPLFVEVGNVAYSIPNPIIAIKATCKCDITSIEITQLPTKGNLISDLFTGNILTGGDFSKMVYLVSNTATTGTEVIKYILHTTCGTSQEGTIELRLI